MDRPWVLRARHARAVQRGHAADQTVAGYEDRAALPVPLQLTDGASLRLERVRVQVPGPAGTDAVALLPELLPLPRLTNPSDEAPRLRPHAPGRPPRQMTAGLQPVTVGYNREVTLAGPVNFRGA